VIVIAGDGVGTATENCEAARCKLEAAGNELHHVGTLLALVKAQTTALAITPLSSVPTFAARRW